MTGVDDLATWLRAQLDEDERDAHHQLAFDAMVEAMRDPMHVNAIVVPPLSQLGSAGDPARALAEVDAKRTLIARLEGLLLYATSPNYAHSGIEAWATDTLKHVALPHAGRDGYREEWRPQ